jgi:hypothetical protein
MKRKEHHSMHRLLWVAIIGGLTVAAFWSFANPGFYYLPRAALLLGLAVAFNHLRMLRRGSSAPLARSTAYAVAFIGFLLGWSIIVEEHGAFESIATFLLGLLVVALLVVLLVVAGLGGFRNRSRPPRGK